MAKDRHRAGYYSEYNKKRKAEGKSTDRHRKGYYAEYNKKHPERLERGFTKGYVNGNFSEGRKEDTSTFITDTLGRTRSRDFFNPTFTDLIESKLSVWHDDDWCEEPD